MKNDFLNDVVRIGDWISDCVNNDQIMNLQTFYNTIISKQWYPQVNGNSIEEAKKHLAKLIELQDLKIKIKI